MVLGSQLWQTHTSPSQLQVCLTSELTAGNCKALCTWCSLACVLCSCDCLRNRHVMEVTGLWRMKKHVRTGLNVACHVEPRWAQLPLNPQKEKGLQDDKPVGSWDCLLWSRTNWGPGAEIPLLFHVNSRVRLGTESLTCPSSPWQQVQQSKMWTRSSPTPGAHPYNRVRYDCGSCGSLDENVPCGRRFWSTRSPVGGAVGEV